MNLSPLSSSSHMLWRTFCGRFKNLILVSGSPKNKEQVFTFWVFFFFSPSLTAGKDGRQRRRGRQSRRWLDSVTYSMDINLSKLWELVQDREAGVRQFTGIQRVRHNLATEQQQNSHCYETHRFIQRVKVDIHRDNAEVH